MKISTLDEIEDLETKIRDAARRAHKWIAEQSDDPMEFLRAVKFEKKGYHPIEHRALNLIEQLNQTWTYAVALAATRWLLNIHPDVGGFCLAPGAHASQDLDIESSIKGIVGAEVFAATSPGSNQKLKKDLQKLAKFPNINYRYVFFTGPKHSTLERVLGLEKPGIQVWSVEI